MPDRHNLGRSLFVPKVKGECWAERHCRREEKNNLHIPLVDVWCQKHKLCFEIDMPYYIVWHFYADGKHAIWCPYKASLVLNGRKDDSLHIHDYKILLITLSRYYGIAPPSPFDLAHYGTG